MRCDKCFTFKGELQLHKNLHHRSRTHVCFVANCNKQYKWPQDFLLHLKTHTGPIYKCLICTYSSHQKRLLKHHLVCHMYLTPHKCQRCDNRCKYLMQHVQETETTSPKLRYNQTLTILSFKTNPEPCDNSS